MENVWKDYKSGIAILFMVGAIALALSGMAWGVIKHPLVTTGIVALLLPWFLGRAARNRG